MGRKWKVVNSMLASDAQKRADLPKESYISQRGKLVSTQTDMDDRDGDADIFSLTGVFQERGLSRGKNMSMGRRCRV